MQAWRVHRNGEPSEVMELEQADRPTPGEGQVLIAVRAANINFPDALLCRGQYQVRPPLPFTPGVEICGETADGRRVLATPALPHGGFAEYVVADEAFSEAGLAWYEVSNWARDPDATGAARCRHNELYWTSASWWGIGPGAHSHVAGERWWNVKHPSAYAARIAASESPAQDG